MTAFGMRQEAKTGDQFCGCGNVFIHICPMSICMPEFA